MAIRFFNDQDVFGDATIEGILQVGPVGSGLKVDNSSNDYNVGIGTASPSAKIHVAGKAIIQTSGTATAHSNTDLLIANSIAASSTSQIQILSGVSGSSNLYFSDTAAYSVGGIQYNHTDNKMTLRVAAGSKMTILSSGNVGIGTTNPTEKLQVDGNIRVEGSAGAGTGNVDVDPLVGAFRINGPGGFRGGIYNDEYLTGNLANSIDDITTYVSAGSYHITLGNGAAQYSNKVLTASGSAIGIGTTTPTQKLHVEGSARITGALYDSTNSAGTSGQVLSSTATGTDWITVGGGTIGGSGTTNYVSKFTGGTTLGNSLIYDNGTNVGIGTTSPTALTGGVNSLSLGGTNSTTSGGLFYQVNGTYKAYSYVISDNYVHRGQSGVYQTFYTNASEKMRITSNGNVGIGATSPNVAGFPSTTLTVEGTSTNYGVLELGSASQTTSGGRLGEIRFYNKESTSPYGFASIRALRNGTAGSSELAFWTSTNNSTYGERMRIDSAGNVGIGTTSPDARLEVSSTALVSDDARYELLITEDNTASAGRGGGLAFTRQGIIYGGIKALQNTSNDDNVSMYFQTRGGGTVTNRMVIDEAGNVGIGTTSPDRQLQVHESTSGTSTAKFTNSTTGEDGDTGFLVGINGFEQPILFGYNSTDMVISTNGAERMRITSTGNVGIGTTSPGHKLDVGGSININNISYAYKINDLNVLSVSANYTNLHNSEGAISIYLGDSVDRTNYYNNNFHRFRTASGSSDYMFINSNGNVGIGTTSPSAKLEVLGQDIEFYSGTGSQSLQLGRNANERLEMYVNDDMGKITAIQDADGNGPHNFILNRIFAGTGSNNFQIQKDGSTQLLINSSGNVGIGTSSPGAKLEINNGSTQTELRISVTGDTGYSTINFSDASDINPGQIYYHHQQNLMNFRTNDNDRMVINSSGNVGIGTTNPAVKLQVDGVIRSKGTSANIDVDSLYGAFRFYNGTTFTGGFYNDAVLSSGNAVDLVTYIASGDYYISTVSASKAVTVKQGGNVGIGTTSPSEKLEVSGNVKASSFIKDGGTSNQFLKADGSVDTASYVSTDNTYNKTESDSIFTSKTLSQNISFGESYASNYRSRVLDYGGTFFPRPLGYEIGLMKEQELFQKAKLSLLPSGVGTGKVHNIKPKNDTFDFTRASTATYVDEDGLIQIADSNVPRLNYPLIDGVVQGCPSLLLEPQITNLALYSEQFDNASWLTSDVTITANQTTSPDGYVNADKVQSGTTSTPHYFGPALMSFVAGNTYTASVFVKKDTGRYFQLVYGSGGFTINDYANFDLENGVVTLEGSGADAIITNYSNGWYRCSITSTCSRDWSDSAYGAIITTANAARSQAHSTALSYWAYGYQVEQGSYPTSYIPTAGAISTRISETANNAGDANTFNDSEGVLMAEIAALADDGSYRQITLTNGTNDVDYAAIVLNSNGTIGGVVRVNSAYNILSGTATQTQINKIALKYKENDFALWINGVEADVSSIGLTPTGLSGLSFSTFVGSNKFLGNTKQLQYFPTALTDTELEELTSWTSFNEMANAQLYKTY